MKKLVLSLIGLSILLSTTTIFGQDELGFASVPNSPQFRQQQIVKLSNPKANQLLSSVYKKYDSFSSLQAGLLVTAQDGASKTSKRGTVTVKGKKYKIETPDQLIVSDGKTNWLYLKRSNSLQITRHVPNDDSFFSYPAVLLKKYQKDYVTKLIMDKTVGGKQITQIDLLPFDDQAHYKKISVEVDKASFEITKLTIFENDKTSFTIQVENLETNTSSIVDSMFTFDTSKVPDNKIIDLR